MSIPRAARSSLTTLTNAVNLKSVFDQQRLNLNLEAIKKNYAMMKYLIEEKILSNV